MNKQSHRLVFNETRGSLMAVAETASAHGKAGSGECAGSGTRTGMRTRRSFRCERMAYKLFGPSLLVSAVSMANGLLGAGAQAQTVATTVIADPTGPATQRPNVFNTGNGVVQVDIRAPSAGGVSRNSYSQFDVGQRGVILNNSRTNAQTQLGGWISGNPWLATGSARVILNEVNSSNPSYLQGYVEVAGQRANVIIANPSGISINGGGFINAAGVTLTTGTPVLNNGNLESFRVQRGSIHIEGQGLDTRSADYTAILSRAVQVNAGLWASRLQVVTGANEVDARNLESDASVQTQSINATGSPPAYAIDVGQLGGMYAGKIMLIGTEAGLGVRNAGAVQASSGALTLTQEGWLSNSGLLQATGGDIQIQSRGALTQSGRVYSNQSVQFSSQTSQSHSGTTAALGHLTLQATGAHTDGSAAHIQASKGAVWAAGLQADGHLTGQQDVTAQAAGPIQMSGQVLATGTLSLQGTSLDVSHSIQQATNLHLQASLGEIHAAGSQLQATEQLRVHTPQRLTTDGAKIQAGTLAINAHSLSNVAGQIVQTGTTDQTIDLQGSLNNSAGLIQTSAHKLSISAQSVDNTAGQLLHAGSGTFSLTSQGQLLNTSQSNSQAAVVDGARIVSVGTMTLQSGTLNNSGEITADQDLNTSASSLNNTGMLYAAGSQILTTGGTLTNSGTIAAAQDLHIGAASLAATGNSVLAAGMAADGKLTGTGALSVSTTGALQSAGQALATGNVTLSSSTLDLSNSTTGSTAGQVSLIASSGDILTKGAQVSTPGLLAVTANNLASQKLDNTSGQLSGQQLRIQVGQVDNSQGLIAQTGTGAQAAQIQTAGSINNSAGRILANAQDLALEVGGSLINMDGQIDHAGAGTFTLSTEATDNSRGKLRGNAGLVITATGDINNTQGLVAAQTLSASVAGWDNSQGQLISTQGDMALGTHQNGINNRQGLIQSAQDLRLTAQGAANNLHNSQGKIVAGRDATLTSGALDNRAGLIGAQSSLSITSTGLVNNAANHNQSSQIYSGSDLTLHATGLDNTASQLLAVRNANLNIGSGSLINTRGLVRVGQSLTLEAASVDNTATRSFHSDGVPQAMGLEGNTVAITANNLHNTQGAVRAVQDLRVYSDGQLTNDQGELSAGRNLLISSAQASAPTLRVSNQAGQIVADQSVSVSTGSLSGTGTIASMGDVSLSLQADHTLAGTLQAGGHLSLSATGQITNPISVQAGKNLSVSAQNLNNLVSGELLSGQTTHLRIANTLNNRGLIDGADSRIEAATLNNLGTGRLYGDRVAIAASTLLNQEENLAGVTAAATIAGRERVDLGVQSLTNREGALIYSANDLAIGGALDGDWRTSGTAQVINNQSATLEAAQNLNLQANTIRNTNEHFASEVRQTSQASITEYQGAGATRRYKPGDPGVYTFVNESLHLNTPEGHYEQWTQYDYTRIVNESVVTQSAPGKILAGGGITLIANTVLNDKSQIVAGGTLSVQAASLNNVQAQGIKTNTDTGTATSYWRVKRKGTDSTGSSSTEYTPAPVQETTTLSVTRFEQNTASASTVSAPTASTLASVQAKAGFAGGSVAAANQAVSLSTVPGGQAESAQTSSTPQGTAAQISARQTPVRTITPSLQLPNTSLFNIQPEAQARYLIETDPQFTNNKIWLGSDHMTAQLQFDPSTTQKRLGDGFYEQKLVREQVLALTGQRFLGDYRSDDAQYMALMNAGLTQAKAMNLRPGISLTSAQVAQLTSDMVWLVAQEVTLANGTKQSVLVPQVYVRVQPGDLESSGALLAGQDVQLKLTGEATNSGTIAGRNLVQINAQSIQNLGGRMRADTLVLQAQEDINNVGGQLQAQSAALLSAGRDINLTTTTQSSANQTRANRFSQTGIDRVAGLYVTGPAGVLLANAGRDLNLTAAQVSNAGTGNTQLTAGNKLNLAALSTGRSETVVTGAGTRQVTTRSRSQSSDVGTQITAQGDVSLNASKDITGTAVQLSARQDLQISAGQTVNLQSGRAEESQTENQITVRRFFGMALTNSSQATSQNSSEVQARLKGQNVMVQSGQYIALQSVNIQGQDIALRADNSLSIDSDQSQSHSRAGSDVRQSVQTQRSQLNALGDVVLYGQREVQVNATDVNAAGKVALISQGNVSLGFNTDTEQYNRTTSSTSRSWYGKKTTTVSQHETVDKTAEVTHLSGAQLQVLGQNVTSQGAQLQGQQLVQVEGVDKTALYAVNEEHIAKTNSLRSSSWMGFSVGKSESQDASLKSQALGTQLSSTQAIRLGVGSVTDVQGALLKASKVDVVRSQGADTSQPGQLILGAAVYTTETRHTEKTTAAGVWQKQSGQGSTTQTAQQTQVNGQLKVASTVEVTAQLGLKPGQSSTEQMQVLSQQPGLSYLKDLQANPKVNWSQLQLAQDQWQYSQQGLTPAGAALLSIAIAAYTGGMGSGLMGSTTATATGTATTLGGTALASTTAATATTAAVTTYTAAGAALNAGFSALAVQAGVALVNNGGDIGKTLQALGSSESIKNILIAMGSAGLGTVVAGQGISAVAAQTAAGCAAGAVSGVGCEQGAKTAAVLSGAGEAYQALVGYGANAGPGENRNGTKLDGTSTGNASYEPIRVGPNFGQQQVADRGMNVIGFNEPGSWGSQGGTLSRALNRIPTINATAGLHDYIFNAQWLEQTSFNNVWTMPVSAAASIPATLNNPNISWVMQSKNFNSIKVPAMQSVIRINTNTLKTNAFAGEEK